MHKPNASKVFALLTQNGVCFLSSTAKQNGLHKPISSKVFWLLFFKKVLLSVKHSQIKRLAQTKCE